MTLRVPILLDTLGEPLLLRASVVLALAAAVDRVPPGTARGKAAIKFLTQILQIKALATDFTGKKDYLLEPLAENTPRALGYESANT